MSTIRLRRAAILLGLALAGSTQTAGAVTPAAVIIRIAGTGISGSLNDLSAKNGIVFLGWTERTGSGVEARYAASGDGGVSYVAGAIWSGHTGARADACQAPLLQAGVTGYPGGQGHRGVEMANGVVTRKIEDSTTDYLRPDIACVGADRIALAVLRKKPAGTRLTLWLFKPDLTDTGVGFDLGPASPTVNPVVVASGGWIHVAWMKGASLRYQRFRMGASPTFALTARPVQVIETTSGQGGPVLGVSGTRVVLAWQRKGSVVARVSTDRGAHFGARRTVMRGAPATARVAFATGADVQGSVLMVSGSVVSEGISADGKAVISTDGGRHWRSRTLANDIVGFTFATLDTNGAGTRLHWANDWRLADPADPIHILGTAYTDLP